MNSNNHQQAKWSTHRRRSPRLNHPQHGSNRTIFSKSGSVPSPKPSYDHMQAWQQLPKETQNALPKSNRQVAAVTDLEIPSVLTNNNHKEYHAGVFSSLIRVIDAELREWQTTTTKIPSTDISSSFHHSLQNSSEESPRDSAIDLNDFTWASAAPRSASADDGPRRALKMLEGRDGEDSPTVPPLFAHISRADPPPAHDGYSLHVTRSNVYRAAGWRRESSVDTDSSREQKLGLVAEDSKERKGVNASTGSETTCVGVMGERTAAEDVNPGPVRRAIRTLRRVSKFCGV